MDVAITGPQKIELKATRTFPAFHLLNANLRSATSISMASVFRDAVSSRQPGAALTMVNGGNLQCARCRTEPNRRKVGAGRLAGRALTGCRSYIHVSGWTLSGTPRGSGTHASLSVGSAKLVCGHCPAWWRGVPSLLPRGPGAKRVLGDKAQTTWQVAGTFGILEGHIFASLLHQIFKLYIFSLSFSEYRVLRHTA